MSESPNNSSESSNQSSNKYSYGSESSRTESPTDYQYSNSTSYKTPVEKPVDLVKDLIKIKSLLLECETFILEQSEMNEGKLNQFSLTKEVIQNELRDFIIRHTEEIMKTPTYQTLLSLFECDYTEQLNKEIQNNQHINLIHTKLKEKTILEKRNSSVLKYW